MAGVLLSVLENAAVLFLSPAISLGSIFSRRLASTSAMYLFKYAIHLFYSFFVSSTSGHCHRLWATVSLGKNDPAHCIDNPRTGSLYTLYNPGNSVDTSKALLCFDPFHPFPLLFSQIAWSEVGPSWNSDFRTKYSKVKALSKASEARNRLNFCLSDSSFPIYSMWIR